MKRLGELLAPSRGALASRSLAGSSARLSAANLAFVALGTLQVLVVGAVFGTGRDYELFVLAWMVPEWCLFGIGNVMQMHLTPALLALSAERGFDQARAASWSLLVCVASALTLACGLAALAAPGLLRLAAPGIAPAEMPRAASLFRWLLLAALAQGLARLMSSLHRVSHSLVIAAIAQNATPLAVIALLWLAPALGSWALVLGFVVGALLNLACLLPGPLAWGLLAPRRSFFHPVVGDLARSALPLLLATTGFRLLVLLDRSVASGLEPGDATLLRYAFFFLLSVQGVVVMPFLSVGYNRLSAVQAQGEKAAAAVVFSFLSVLWLAVLPATLALVAFAAPLVQLFLGRAAFDALAVARTAGVLEAMAPALPFLVGHLILLQAFLVRRRYAFAVALSLVLPLGGFAWKLAAGPRLGVRGVAGATALTMAVWFLALLLRLLPRAAAEARRLLFVRLGLALLAFALAAAALAAVRPWLPHDSLARLLLGGTVLAASYAAALLLFGRGQVRALWDELRGTAVGA